MNTRTAFLLLLMAPLTARAGLVGTVIALDGHPLPGAHIAATTPETRQERLLRLVSRRKVNTIDESDADSAGNFTLHTNATDVVDVSVTLSGHVPVTLRLRSPSDDAGVIVLPRAAWRRMHASAGGTAVGNATVIALSDFESAYSTTTDDHGDFELPDPDVWASRLIVLHNDYAPFVRTRNFGERFPAVIELQSGASVAGTAIADDGTAVAGAGIWIDGIPISTSDGGGHWVIAHAPAQWTRVSALIDDRYGASTHAASPVIRVSGARIMHGTVRDSMTSRPVAGIELRQMSGTSAPELSTYTASDGTFRMPCAGTGEVTVAGIKPGYRLLATARADDLLALRAEPTSIIRGMVNDEYRRPVGAALVMVSGSRSTTGPPVATYSGPDGHFVLREVPILTTHVEATKSGYFSEVKDVPALHGAGAVFTIARGLDLRGTIVDAQALPVSGARIGVRSAGRAVMMSTTESGPEGSFSLHLRSGLYDVGVARDGYSTAWRKNLRIDETTPPLRITLDRGVTQEGRIVTHTGDAARGYYVRPLVEGPPIKPVPTDDDGKFRLEALSPGTALLQIGKGGNGFLLTRQIAVPARDLTITLPDTGTLHGRVIDKGSGQAISKFTIDVISPRDNVRLVAPMVIETDDGHFEVPDAPRPPLMVCVRAEHHAVLQRALDAVVETQDVVLELQRSVTVSGHVTDETGRAVAGVRVTPHDRSLTDTVTTGESGEYGLEISENGSEELRFDKPGYESSFLEIGSVTSTDGADVVMKHGRQLSGTVVDDNGDPVPGALVTTAGAAAVVSDDHGAFLLTGSACPCTVTATRSGYVAAAVNGLSAPAASIELRLRRGVSLEGVVSGVSPAELTSTRVAVLTSTGVLFGDCDASGHYRVDGLPQGSSRAAAQLQFGGSSRSSEEITFDVESTDLHRDFAFAQEPVIVGRVSRDNEPIPGARLTFQPRSNGHLPHASTTTASDGTYRVAGLGSGQYEIVIDAGGVHQSQFINVTGSTRADLSIGE